MAFRGPGVPSNGMPSPRALGLPMLISFLGTNRLPPSTFEHSRYNHFALHMFPHRLGSAHHYIYFRRSEQRERLILFVPYWTLASVSVS